MKEQNNENEILNNAFYKGAQNEPEKEPTENDFLKNLIENDENAPEVDPVSELNDVVFSGGSKLQSERFVENSKKMSKVSAHVVAEEPASQAETKTEELSETEANEESSFISFEEPEKEEIAQKRESAAASKALAKKDKKSSMSKGQKAVLAVLLVIFIIILALVLTVVIMHFLGKKNTMADNYGDNFRDTIVYNGVTYHYNPDVTSVAFLGVDRETFGLEDDLVGTAGQSDVNMVVAIDTKTGKSNVVVIPRDVYCDIDKYSHSGKYIGTQKAQLCLAYSYGDGKTTSCVNSVTSIQRILYGVPINTYVALNLDGIAKLNDCIGGVSLVCPNDFREYTKGESITLHGDEAQNFIRSREHTLTGDENRRERQVSYVEAYVSQTAKMSIKDPSTLRKVYDTGKGYTVTNLTLSRGLFFSTVILSNPAEIMNFRDVVTLTGEVKEDKLHYAQTVLDEKAALETVLGIYYVPEK